MATTEEAREVVEQVQAYDVGGLGREATLGQAFGFAEAIPNAQKAVDLWRRLPLDVLDELPPNLLNQVHGQATETLNLFREIGEFEPTQSNAHQVRTQLLGRVEGLYDSHFSHLYTLIAYSLHRTADFAQLAEDAHAAIAQIQERTQETVDTVNRRLEEADGVLAAIREVAAEAGVSHQAEQFRLAAEEHESQSKEWQTRTNRLAFFLGLYALAALTLHKIPWLAPTNAYETVQLTVGKILLFGVFSFALYLAARNFLAHKHNAIVNRHRQNALLTFRALVEAAGETQHREIILVQAAACIFGPQATGYTSQEGGPPPPGAQSVIEFLSRSPTGGG